MLDELRAIAARAPDPRRALGDQLAPRDAARFAELSQQLRQMQLSAYVESAHARDAGVVEEMFLAARKAYADPTYRPADDDVAGTVLVVLRSALPKDDPWSPATEVGCTVDTALAREETAGLRRVNVFTPMLHRDMPIIRQLRAQYGVDQDGKLDPSRMSPEDARTWETIQVEMQPAFRERTLALDLQHIRAWWAAADIVYRSRKEDISIYVSIDHIGDTLDAWADRLSPEQRGLIGIWKLVDERVWSQERRDTDRAAKAAQAAHPTAP